MEPQLWVSMGLALLGGMGTTFTILRGGKQDRDTRIDERVRLLVGVELAEIRSSLSDIRERMPSRDSQIVDSGRISALEGRVHILETTQTEILGRLRAVENTCARHQVGGGGA